MLDFNKYIIKKYILIDIVSDIQSIETGQIKKAAGKLCIYLGESRKFRKPKIILYSNIIENDNCDVLRSLVGSYVYVITGVSTEKNTLYAIYDLEGNFLKKFI